jgi:stage IV sporulation protein A
VNSKEILKDIGARTNGDVYLGVVGPVRTGKSTFIKRFMEIAVVPNIQDEYLKGRTIDELPQSGEGKTIMTTEPKFIPSSAATVQIDEEVSIKVRLVDCVGFVIPSAKGYKDEEGVRMVKTPWLEEAIPFDEAAKIGTQKVIQEHSSIGVVVTSDGTITDIAQKWMLGATGGAISVSVVATAIYMIVIGTKKLKQLKSEVESGK